MAGSKQKEIGVFNILTLKTRRKIVEICLLRGIAFAREIFYNIICICMAL